MNDVMLRELTRYHGLDGGGYEFERLDALPDCAVWDDPDLDYVLGGGRADVLALAHAPASLPEWYRVDGTVYARTATGILYGHDTPCDCHGEPDGGGSWVYSGDGGWGSDPYPDCDRCDGAGYLSTQAHHYGCYQILDVDDLIEGAARAAWACAWSDLAEEEGQYLVGETCVPSVPEPCETLAQAWLARLLTIPGNPARLAQIPRPEATDAGRIAMMRSLGRGAEVRDWYDWDYHLRTVPATCCAYRGDSGEIEIWVDIRREE